MPPPESIITICRVEDDEVALARDLHNRFTDQEKPMETVRSWYEEVPSLFLFAVADDEVIGVCTGRPRDKREVSLAGIGLEPDRRGEGIGTRLVKRFEDNARDVGIERISVAAAGGEVDDFYPDNGFRPEQTLVMNPAGGPEDYDDTGFDREWDGNEDGSRKCYVDVNGYDSAVLETVQNEFDDNHALYILAKDLDVR